MAEKKNDPTVSKSSVADDTNRAPLVSDADHAAPIGTFKDNPDKPDPSTVAQVQVLDDEDSK